MAWGGSLWKPVSRRGKCHFMSWGSRNFKLKVVNKSLWRRLVWWKHMHQFSTVAQSCLTLCNPMNCSMPGLPVHHQLLENTQTHVHWVGDATQPSHPLSSLLLLPSIVPSIRVFSNESALHIRWPNYWSFSFNISPTSVQWTPRTDLLYGGLVRSPCSPRDSQSLLQYHSSKASILSTQLCL